VTAGSAGTDRPDAVAGGRFTVGVGVASAAGPDEVARLVSACLSEAGVARDQVDAIATVDARVDHPAVVALGWPVRGYPRGELADAGPPPAGPSRLAVAEPAALLAAGPGATLVVPKRRSAHATAAVARSARVG
jgi:cobalamin biosynthesis protein CbiG